MKQNESEVMWFGKFAASAQCVASESKKFSASTIKL